MIKRVLYERRGLRLAAMLALCLAPLMASADFTMTNPVTGETENYTWKFVGTTHIWDGSQYWQDSNGGNPTAVPAKSGDNIWDPVLFDGNTININASMSVEGWNLRMGLYNGASVTLKNLQKLQGGVGMWITVDSSSHCTIAHMGNKKLSGANPLCLYSANEGGIAWAEELSSSGNGGGDTAMPFHYYLAGNGTVAYNGGIAAAAGGAHVIKQADVTLSGTSQVSSKTLVSFTSSSTTFTADAAIKVYDTDGTTLKETVAVTSVRSSGAAIQNTTSALTTDDAVGTCELVQCTDGIVLYYVDGDPSAVVAKTYTPSININFTSGTALSTAADVGLAGYAVPGTSWNNLTVANNATLSSLNKIDSTGAATASSASVTITNTRGSWSCSSLAAASDLRAGYIDETADVTTPTVTVSGIPYDQYKVVVYTATDAANVAFGYVTINGTDYTYSDGAVAEGTTAWGASGAQNTAEALAEGVNVLVSPVVSGATLTVVGHRSGNNPRGCIAAVQIVKVEQQVGENDLLIELDGDRTYTFSEAKAYSGTVYVTGEGTLTFDGAASTAETLHIGAAAAVNMVGSSLTPTVVIGKGTAIYDGEVPPTDKGWTDSANWTGTVWIKNKSGITGNSTAATGVQPNNLGNANSKVKFSGVSGWLEAPITYTPEIVLENDAYDYALKLTNGNSPDNKNNNENRCTVIKKLSGNGKVTCGESSNSWPTLKVYDASTYTGDIDCGSSGTCLVVVFAAENETLPDTLYALFNSAPRSIYISANSSATVASGATWTAKSGIIVNGTLYANGTLASSAASAVKGSGTVVFTGRAPTPTGNAWWKNSAWTGTVEIKNHNFSANIALGTYGNSGSKVCMNGSEAYLQVLNNPDHNIAELVIAAGGFTQDGTYSSGTVTFTLPFKVTGTGVYTLSAGGNANKIVNLTGDLSEFAGYLSPAGANTRFVVGSTTRDFVAKSVVVGSDKVLSMGNFNAGPDGGLFIDEGGQVIILDSGFLWTTGGVTVDGTLTTSSRANRIGGGTAITLGDNGVLEITGNNADESTAEYNNISGTGSIKYSGSGYLVLSANYPTDIPLIDEKENALVVPAAGATIGSLSGTKGFRSDWGNTPNEGRYLTIKQAKDTTWSGSINQTAGNRLTGVVVDSGTSTTGTLTMSGTQTATVTLAVNGSVNLTGTWIGATTVAGTFGGTGTLTGNLTFSDGATFMATNTPLTVTGGIKVPATGVVTVDVSRVTFDADTITILKSSNGFDYSDKFTLIGYVPDGYVLKERLGALVLTKSSGGDTPEPAGDQARFWVKNFDNADVNVYTNGVLLESVGAEDGFNIYYPNGGADATIVYSAKEGYVIVGHTRYPATQIAGDLAFDEEDIVDMAVKSVDELTEVAFVTDSDGVNTLYETLNDAFDAVESNETVTLIRDAELTNNVALDFSVVVAGYDCKMGGPLTLASGSSLTMESGVAITNDIVVTDCKVTVTYPTEADNAPTVTPPEGYDAVTTDNGDGTSTISFKVPTPSSGYTVWREENSIEGDWDADTAGVANVFRYVFGEPSETFQLITNITFNADSHAVIWTPKMVNDTKSAEFNIYVVASADLAFDDNDTSVPYKVDPNGETEIDEDLHKARFFRLKAEKKSQE